MAEVCWPLGLEMCSVLRFVMRREVVEEGGDTELLWPTAI